MTAVLHSNCGVHPFLRNTMTTSRAMDWRRFWCRRVLVCVLFFMKESTPTVTIQCSAVCMANACVHCYQPILRAICGIAMAAMPACPSTPGCPPHPSIGGPLRLR